MSKAKKNTEKKVDTPNKGHKHIFGSSEKSDFILNMTQEGAEKLCGRFLIVTMLLVTALIIPAYFTETVVTYSIDGSVHMLSDNFLFYGAAAVMLMGFLGFLVYMIACSKKIASVKGNKELYLAAAIMVISAVSAFTAASLEASILGYIGRHEGLLSVCAWYGIFGVGLCVNKEGLKTTVMDFLVGIGALHSIVAVFQFIPATAPGINKFFEYLYFRAGSIPVTDEEVYYEGGYALTSGIYTHTPAASGFTGTPFALAALLTITFAAALAGSAFGKGGKRRVLYGIGAVLMSAAACLTRTTPAIAGITAGAVVVTLFILIGIGPESTRRSAFAGLVPVALSAACCLCLILTGATDFRDEQIIFTDGYVNKSITSLSRRYVGTQEDIFTYAVKDGLNIISSKPILGIGPDNGIYVFEDYSLTTDRFYNEYVDGAAGRGVIAEGLHIIFLLICLVKLTRSLIAYKKDQESWTAAACTAGVLAYLIQAFFNTTWFSASYLLFLILGLGCHLAPVTQTGKKKGNKRK